MIYTHIPYSSQSNGNNLGSAYNDFMQLLKDDDWAIFLDHDAMFTTTDWYRQIENLISSKDDIGIIGAVTNRIGNNHHKPPIDLDSSNHDIKYHRRIGLYLQEHGANTLTDFTNSNDNHLLSGVVIVIQKKTWNEIDGCMNGFLGVDNDIHKRVRNLTNKKVYIAEGLYVYHWYRESL